MSSEILARLTMLSVYGIFVIETKNYKGWIFGSEQSEEWTQDIYGKKFSLRNPIKQNYGHVKALQRQLSEYGKFPIYSIIAFSRKCKLKVHVNDSCVVYYYQVLHEIKKHSQVVMDFGTADKMAWFISQNDVSGKRDVIQKHIRQRSNKLFLTLHHHIKNFLKIIFPIKIFAIFARK